MRRFRSARKRSSVARRSAPAPARRAGRFCEYPNPETQDKDNGPHMTTASLPELDLSPAVVEAARTSKAWPFEEARKLLKRVEKAKIDRPVLFETGYGPSGLPHIDRKSTRLNSSHVKIS